MKKIMGEFVSQQEAAHLLSLSRATMVRRVRKWGWIPTLDRRNNHAKCYPVKWVAEKAGVSEKEILKQIREHRIEIGHEPSRKLSL